MGSYALLVPAIWVFINSTRPIAYWAAFIGFGNPGAIENESGDSNPVNTIVVLLLICAALMILLKRGLAWSELILNNKALFLIYGYLALSFLWAPDGGSAIRRIIKDFGNVLVALVILTEDRPWQSARILLVRLSYVMLPLSLVVAKYFPNIGRNASRAGETMYTGLMLQKNSLGQVTTICCLVLLWDLFEIYKEVPARDLKTAKIARWILLVICAVLMLLADSTTAQLCLMFGICLFLYLKRVVDLQRGQRVIGFAMVGVLAAFALESMFGVAAIIVGMFGKDLTFTGRTDIWAEAIRLMDNPLLGYGYYQFWFTPKADLLYANLGDLIHIKTAHNGYVEAYLDGGMIGLVFFSLFLLTIVKKSYDKLTEKVAPMAVPLLFCVYALISNNSESTYFRNDPLWFSLLLFTTRYTQSIQAHQAMSPATAGGMNSLIDKGPVPPKSVETVRDRGLDSKTDPAFGYPRLSTRQFGQKVPLRSYRVEDLPSRKRKECV
jgi:O-antigen ligase